MYPHVKRLLVLIIALLVIIVVYQFRGYFGKSAFVSKTIEKASEPIIGLTTPQSSNASDTGDSESTDMGDKSARPSSDPGPPAHFRKKMALAQDLLEKDDLLNARRVAENLLMDPHVAPYSGAWLEAAELVSKINTIFLFSDAPCPEKEGYIVVPGDNLVKIAKRFNSTVSMVQRSNNLDETNPMIYPDQVFHIYQADWNIKVSKSNFLLTIYDGDRVVKIYHVGIGRQDRTPVGVFVIDLKDFEPDWWKPGKLVRYGDPENVLGTRWLGLKPVDGTDITLKGYGIHGTWEPETIGTAASQGCVRMVNSDVEELFDIIPLDTKVVIVE